jgi:uncharacterized membrane protein HdeD (DUF308 family)
MNQPRSGRPRVILLSGIATLILGVAALLLPLIRHLPGGAVVGCLLLLAGLLEFVAGSARASSEARRRAMMAGGFTSLAGLLFLLDVFIPFFAANYLVIGWLLLRGALLLHLAGGSTAPVRGFVRFGGFADIALGLILLAGLPIAALVVALFGPTPEVVASFALVFAASFLVTGLVLLLVARTEARIGEG